mgnify:CR=1 FL=1
MRLLLDTHLLIWAAQEDVRLPKAARVFMENETHELVFSAASLWEIVIKRGLERQDFQVEPSLLRRGLLDNGWQELPVLSLHTLAVARLPALHKDPFDRLLLAQAETEGMLLLTTDRQLASYGGPVQLV